MPTMLTTLDISHLSDHQLLANTKDLARRERDLNLRIIEHLREIGTRRLHLRDGYGSLFDYAVKELGFGEGSAFQRLQALKLSDEFPEVKEDLQDGELTLTAAGYLQSAFDRDQRRQRQQAREPRRSGVAGTPVVDGMTDAGGAGAGDEAPQSVAPEGAQTAGAGSTPLSSAAKRELIERARGKSTRQVRELIAEFDPELVRPRDRLRALGGERWELKAVVDGECRRGLDQLLHWLAHVNPTMGYGELLQRLVVDAVAKYDPARTPTRAGRHASAAVAAAVGAGSKSSERRKHGAEVVASVAGVPPDNQREQRIGSAAHQPSRYRGRHVPPVGPATKNPAGNAQQVHARAATGGASNVAPTEGRIAAAELQPSAPQPESSREEAARKTTPATRRTVDISASVYQRGGQRHGVEGSGGATSAPSGNDRDRPRGGEAGCGGHAAFAQKRTDTVAIGGIVALGGHHAANSRDGVTTAYPGDGGDRRRHEAAGSSTGTDSAHQAANHGGPERETADACGGATAAHRAGVRGGSKRETTDAPGDATAAHQAADRSGPKRETTDAPGDATAAHQAADRGGPERETAGTRGGATAAHRAGVCGGPRRGVVGHGDRAAFAQKRGCKVESRGRGAAGQRPRATITRAIPAAVRRHIWLRDGGRCTYKDPESGRCCESRHLLQIDHIQPFAIGGATSADNLRLLCAAHNRARRFEWGQRSKRRASLHD